MSNGCVAIRWESILSFRWQIDLKTVPHKSFLLLLLCVRVRVRVCERVYVCVWVCKSFPFHKFEKDFLPDIATVIALACALNIIYPSSIHFLPGGDVKTVRWRWPDHSTPPPTPCHHPIMKYKEEIEIQEKKNLVLPFKTTREREREREKERKKDAYRYCWYICRWKPIRKKWQRRWFLTHRW